MHWFYDPSLHEASNELPTEESHHALSSLRIRAGENIAVTDGSGRIAFAEVSSVDSKKLSYIIQNFEFRAALMPKITLVQALAKADRDELALQTCVELGVSAVLPWESDRSVVKWSPEKQIKGLSRWSQIAVEAMKQSHQAYLCSVSGPFEPSKKIEGQVIVLDPTGAKKLTELQLSSTEPLTLIVGPEGGISESELRLFDSLGYVRAKLGTEILRTSTAGPAAVASIRTMLGSW